jgi:hypothetical protein
VPPSALLRRPEPSHPRLLVSHSNPHRAPTARLRPTSRGLSPSPILTVKQARYRPDTHRSILTVVYHFSLLEAHQSARTLYTAATLRTNCTASWQSKRRRQPEATHISHTTSCTFHIPHLPEAIGLYQVLHWVVSGPCHPARQRHCTYGLTLRWLFLRFSSHRTGSGAHSYTQHLQFYIMLIRIPLTELHVLWLLILAHRVPKSKYKKACRQIHYRLLQVT